ncbi:MAG: hypothetical protein M1819_003700 [Sarea resinae]|nr:MAG: hypothetical protein M1819_003700 [Sarea resinae]
MPGTKHASPSLSAAGDDIIARVREQTLQAVAQRSSARTPFTSPAQSSSRPIRATRGDRKSAVPDAHVEDNHHPSFSRLTRLGRPANRPEAPKQLMKASLDDLSSNLLTGDPKLTREALINNDPLRELSAFSEASYYSSPEFGSRSFKHDQMLGCPTAFKSFSYASDKMLQGVGKTLPEPVDTRSFYSMLSRIAAGSSQSDRVPLTDEEQENIWNSDTPVQQFGMIQDFIEHTNLEASTAREIEQLCREAQEYQFKSVCVKTQWVSQAVSYLRRSDVTVTSVIDCPERDIIWPSKDLRKRIVAEAKESTKAGASDIEMTLDSGLLLAEKYEEVFRILDAVRDATPFINLRVVIETHRLSELYIMIACQLAEFAGADYVATSAGESESLSTTDDVVLMRQYLRGRSTKVKASGTIMSLEQCEETIMLGADVIGTRYAVGIMNEVARRARHAVSEQSAAQTMVQLSQQRSPSRGPDTN